MSDDYLHRHAAHLNANLQRDDIEWVVAGGSLKLQDKPSWSQRRTRELEIAAERSRQQFNHRQRYPIQDAAE